MYASLIWVRALRVGQLLLATQRKILLRVACAYRTVSGNAVKVITGVPPMDLLIEEGSKIWEEPPGSERRGEERELLLTRWQERWDGMVEEGQWTKRLILIITEWESCPHRTNSYFLTQFLSGHGSFRVYTKRIGNEVTENCIYCRARDTPEHTVFECPRWERIRVLEWGDLVGIINPDNIVRFMVSDKETWTKICGGIKKIES